MFVSKAGPSLVPSDGRTLADGPLGGMFLDQSFLEIWQTNQVHPLILKPHPLILTKPETRNPTSEIRNPKSEIRRPESRDRPLGGMFLWQTNQVRTLLPINPTP